MRKMHDNIRLYHVDHLGSTSLVSDAEGLITQHVAYIPYGEVFVEQRNGSWNTPYLFNAKELDEETGLYYYGARYLDPTNATWLSVDPLFEKYVGMTPYGYCAGNPVKMVDPDGEAPKSLIEYRGNGVFGINKSNLSNATQRQMNLENNDPKYWRPGEIGVNTTILSLSFKPYRYDGKFPGIDPADRNRTHSNRRFNTYEEHIRHTKKGEPYKTYTPRTFTPTYRYMGNAPIASGKAFSYGTLAVDFAVMAFQNIQTYDMYSDVTNLDKQREGLIDAFKSVRNYVSDGGSLPPEYNNSDGYGKLVNYLFKGGSSLNAIQDLKGQYHIDDTIQQIGNQILRDNGRYDEKSGIYKYYIED